MDKGIEALTAAAKKYSETFNAHRESPRDAKAVEAWDAATYEFDALVKNEELNIIASLIAALEQAQQEYQAIEQKLINAAVYIETLESEPRKTNLKLLNEIAGLKRTCVELQASHYDLRESMGAIHNTIRGEGAHVSLSVLLTASKNAWDKSKSAAAITVEGSE